jgi:hypothetical protein
MFGFKDLLFDRYQGDEMMYQGVPFWEVALDGVQILLGGVILIFLIRNKKKFSRPTLNPSADNHSGAFSSEIILQSLKQQTEHTLDAIVNFINQERLALGNFYEIEEIKHRNSFVFGSEDKILIDDQTDERRDSEAKVSDFEQILMLSKKGLDVKDISEKLNIPRGEVELMLRLKNKGKK